MGLFDCLKKSYIYPKEILLLNYLDKKNINTCLPSYWSFEYKLDTPNVIKKLLTYDYLQYAPNEFVLSKCKVDELKNIIVKNNLKPKGKKDNLIDIIKQNIPDYQKYLTEKYYLLTEKGKNIVEQNEHLIYWHLYRNVLNFSLDEIDSEKQKYPELSKYDLALNIVKKYENKNLKAKNYEAYRNNLFVQSEILWHMENIEEQLRVLLQVCYLDLTIGNYKDTGFSIPPGVIGKLISALEELHANIDDYEGYFNNLTFNFISKNICYKADFNRIRFEINRI